MTRDSWLLPIALFFASSVLFAQEETPSDTSESSKEKDWLEFYYENPKPGRLVSEVRKWAKDGTLENETARPAIIAFLSQVFRQNRDEIAGWYRELAGLNQDHQQILHTAMLYSRTTEADDLLRQRFGDSFDKQKKVLPKILEMNLAQKNTLDMLWGFFYATGSENAIRRVIWSFRFEDAPDNPDFAKIPKDHQPLYKVVPDAAAWMLSSNAQRHPKVVEICEKFYADKKSLLPTERRRLGKVLAEVKPERYLPKPKP